MGVASPLDLRLLIVEGLIVSFRCCTLLGGVLSWCVSGFRWCVKTFCYLFYCLLFGIGCDIFYVCGDIDFSCIISLLFLFGGSVIFS